jgi:hypothetical protein
MQGESRYQAARIVSATVADHFAAHLASARKRGEKDLASAPEASVIETIIDSAFWASLRREEGHSPKISLALLPPEQATQPLLFAKKMPLTSDILTKLSPGVERPGIHLGVWFEGDEIYIWGTTLSIPYYCFVLDVSDPGLLVIKHRRLQGFGKFSNVAVLVGDQVKIVDENSASAPDSPALLASLLGLPSDDSLNVLIYLAVSMRSHKRGGTVLVVPEQSEKWKDSIIHPAKYHISPSYPGIKNLMQKDSMERNHASWRSAMRNELDSIAGLTAVDGATIISDQYNLLAFGTKITRPGNSKLVEQISFYEPIIGAEPVTLNPSQSGGTRHLSAAQFIHDQREALALVASQDGHFTIFTWSARKNMVQAHRIDTLLL